MPRGVRCKPRVHGVNRDFEKPGGTRPQSPAAKAWALRRPRRSEAPSPNPRPWATRRPGPGQAKKSAFGEHDAEPARSPARTWQRQTKEPGAPPSADKAHKAGSAHLPRPRDPPLPRPQDKDLRGSNTPEQACHPAPPSSLGRHAPQLGLSSLLAASRTRGDTASEAALPGRDQCPHRSGHRGRMKDSEYWATLPAHVPCPKAL